MEEAFAFIGFGEAAAALSAGAPARGFDRKTDVPETRASKLADFAAAGVRGCASAAEAVAGMPAVLSLVTADQALAAAQQNAPQLTSGALWFDMNSVAPDTKRAAAEAVEEAGGRYVDVAVMAPVHPARRASPLLVSGPHARVAVAVLSRLGFTSVTAMEGAVGAASSIKMIRSVMVKGLEALTAECALAAYRAGVADHVFASLDASWPGANWRARTNYNLDRMMVHGLRRAAEMEEVIKTLEALGTGSAMTRGTVERQRAIGALQLSPDRPLDDKFEAILGYRRDEAA